MSEEIVLKEVEVQKLRLRPGDVLVISLPKDTKHSWMANLGRHLTRILPRNPSLIIANDVKISVVSKEEAEKIAKGLTEVSDGNEG